MTFLFNAIQRTLDDNHERPFSIYTSFKEQKLLNVPIPKP